MERYYIQTNMELSVPYIKQYTSRQLHISWSCCKSRMLGQHLLLYILVYIYNVLTYCTQTITCFRYGNSFHVRLSLMRSFCYFYLITPTPLITVSVYKFNSVVVNEAIACIHRVLQWERKDFERLFYTFSMYLLVTDKYSKLC